MQSKPEVCFPGTCIGNTDSRHFTNVTDAIYRFNPVLLKSDDLPRYCILSACGQLFGVGSRERESWYALGWRKPSLVYLGVVLVLLHVLQGHPFPAYLGAAQIGDGNYTERALALTLLYSKCEQDLLQVLAIQWGWLAPLYSAAVWKVLSWCLALFKRFVPVWTLNLFAF